MLAVMVMLVLACIAVAAIAGTLWVSTAAAAVVLAVNIVLGRRYDESLRQDLRAGDEGRR